MIYIHSRFYRPNGDYYTVVLGFECHSLMKAVQLFEAFSNGFYAATEQKIGWERVLPWHSSSEIVFKVPSEITELAKYLKSKGLGCVQSSSS